VKYFVSGVTFGAYSLNKPTDRYEVTVAYRDPQGQERVYHSHQDLLFSTGSKVFGRDEHDLEGLQRYSDIQAAFNGVVNNSVYGTRRGTITAGMPRFDTPTTPAASPANPAPAVPAEQKPAAPAPQTP
jgi:hypothetical protein